MDATALKAALQKKAEAEKPAAPAAVPAEIAERMNAFDFGVELFCKEAGLDKTKLAQGAGLKSAQELAPALVVWLTQETAQAK